MDIIIIMPLIIEVKFSTDRKIRYCCRIFFLLGFIQLLELWDGETPTVHVLDLIVIRQQLEKRYKRISKTLEVLQNTVMAIITKWRKLGTMSVATKNRTSLKN